MTMVMCLYDSGVDADGVDWSAGMSAILRSISGIESVPGVCGGEPCIAHTRIPVWALEWARRLGMTEDQLLLSYPTLRAEDIANAWAFVRSHSAEIDEQIRTNEAA
jgi:uncharacterized protein (DUF433 family)